MRIVRDTLEAPNADRTLVALSLAGTFKLICDAGIAYISENGGAWTPLSTGAVLSGWARTGAAPPAAGLISELNAPDQVAIGAAAPPTANTKLYVQGTANPGANDATLRIAPVAGQSGDLIMAERAGAAMFRASVQGDVQAFQDLLSGRNVTAVANVQGGNLYVVDGIVRSNVANLAAFTGVTGGTRVDGALFLQGARLLLQAQTSDIQNGIYVVGVVAAGTAALTRAPDWATGQTKMAGATVVINNFNSFSDQNQDGGDNISSWMMILGPCVVGTSGADFSCADVLGTGAGLSGQQKTYFAQAVHTTNVANLAAFPAAANNDGVTLVEGDVVLLVAQATAAQNGPYMLSQVSGGNAALVRPPWFETGRSLDSGFAVRISRGTVFAGTNWVGRSAGAIVVGTNDPVFYPERVCGSTALVGGTFTTTTVPILSATKTNVVFDRQAAAGSALTVGGYHPTTGGANGLTAGIIGVGQFVVEACVAAGTINNVDTSTLHWTVLQ